MAQFLTAGHGPLPVHGPGVGDPAPEEQNLKYELSELVMGFLELILYSD